METRQCMGCGDKFKTMFDPENQGKAFICDECAEISYRQVPILNRSLNFSRNYPFFSPEYSKGGNKSRFYSYEH